MTGVLRAKVNGEWVVVSSGGGGAGGGAEEVHVGTSAPAQESIELWYDSDAPALLPDDTRWNTAWGVTKRYIKPSLEGGYAAGSEWAIAGLTGVLVAATAGRMTRINYGIVIAATTSPPSEAYWAVQLRLGSGTGGATQEMQIHPYRPSQQNFGVGYISLQGTFLPLALPAGQTVTLTIRSGAGQMAYDVGATTYLVAEDAGPVVAGSPAAMNVENRWNTAWGSIARVPGTLSAFTVNQTWQTVYTVVASLVAGRQYELRWTTRAVNSAAMFLRWRATVSPTTGHGLTFDQIYNSIPAAPANWDSRPNVVSLVPTASGTYTFLIQSSMDTGTATMYTDLGGFAAMVDVGPVAGSTPAPPPTSGVLPVGMITYGPFETAVSPNVAPNTEYVLTHIHNLNLPDPNKCVVAAMAMDGSWAGGCTWRTAPAANSVNFYVINQNQSFNMQVKFRYMIFQGA